jgi:hypothetical protein
MSGSTISITVLSAALDSICRGAANKHEHLGASQGVNSQINYLSMFSSKTETV